MNEVSSVLYPLSYDGRCCWKIEGGMTLKKMDVMYASGVGPTSDGCGDDVPNRRVVLFR